ncbi:hypothetical protein GCM10010430_07530 [Kitasatospora cystarginea]|uniref:Uncharacterized protein n=1 Tax=Kitasatospora cystarginea TaxID=58350 RepID=A0ABP5QA78_9ACTN
MADQVPRIDVGLHAVLHYVLLGESRLVGGLEELSDRHFTRKAIKSDSGYPKAAVREGVGLSGVVGVPPDRSRPTGDLRGFRWYPGRDRRARSGESPIPVELREVGRRRSKPSPESLRHPYRVG